VRDRTVKAAAGDVAASDPQARILTIPNAISVARLLGVPVFLWLVLGPRSEAGDWWAVALLIAAGLSDWLDGKIARALNQPWWLVGLLAARELVLGVVLLVLRRHGYGPLQVSFAGKTATLALLYAFPLLFLGSHTASYSETARIIGWAFAIWGSALYWLAALLYVEQARRLVREDRENGRDRPPGQVPGGDREAGQR